MSARVPLRSAFVLALAALVAPAAAAEVALSFADAPGGPGAGFRIERRAAGAKRFEPLALVGPGVVEFVDRSAPAGRLLCYRVRPLASRAAADWSSEVCARAVAPARPAAAAVADAAPGPEGEATPGPGGEAAKAPPAVSSGAPPERRVRAGGGWLQVLE